MQEQKWSVRLTCDVLASSTQQLSEFFLEDIEQCRFGKFILMCFHWLYCVFDLAMHHACNLESVALPARLSLGFPIVLVIHCPILLTSSRSTPVLAPKL